MVLFLRDIENHTSAPFVRLGAPLGPSVLLGLDVWVAYEIK